MLYRSTHERGGANRGAATPAPFDLLRWFAILSALAVAVIAIGTALFLARFVERASLTRDAAVVTQFVNNLFLVEEGEGFFRADAAAGPGDIEEFFAHLSRLPGVLRANAFDRDRRIVWSSDPALVGQRFADNDELEAAFRGQPVAAIDRAGARALKAEQVAMTAPGARFVENYLPVLGAADAMPVGVIEIYRVPPGLFDTIDAAVSRIVWGTGMAGLLLYASLFAIVWRGTRLVQAQEARLLAAEKLATAGEMASAVAHGLRNPLASIRSSAELALSTDPAGEVGTSLRDIVGDVDRLESWIRQYLVSVRPGNGDDQETEVGRVLEAAVRDAAGQLERCGLTAEVALEANLPAVALNALILRQLVNGLLANAIEALPRGGTVRVAAAAGANRAVLLRVADDGPGMTPSQRERALQPFVTSKPGGLGLGLPLAREILARHGGDLRIDSRAGHGTVVELHLPVAAHR
jgi:signal transduction histidine kinase